MADPHRGCRTVPWLVALLLFVSPFYGEPFGGRSPQIERSADFWKTLLPLGGSGGRDRVARAFQQAGRLGRVFGEMVLRRTMDPELRRAFDVILQRSQDLDLQRLYSHPGVPWREGSAGRKSFTYGGRVQADGYHLSLALRPPPLLVAGDMVGRLAMSPSRRGYLFELEHELHTGPLGMEEELAMVEILFGLLDAGRQFAPVELRPVGREGPEDLYVEELFQGSFPRLASFLSRYLQVMDIAQVYRDPLLGEPVTRLELTVRVREEFLKRQHPPLYRAYEKLIRPSASVIRVRDASGHLLGESLRTGGLVSVRFLTRRGLLYPADERWQVADRQGLSPYRLRQLPHVVSLSAWVRVLGLKFGMRDVSLQSSFRAGISTWSLSQAPALILPLGIKQLFAPFLRPFLERLCAGEDRQGLRYQLAFRSSGEEHIHRAYLSLPLRDSPLLSFLLRLGGGLSRALSPEVRQELHGLLAEMAEALGRDYRRARADRLVASLQ